MKRKRVLALLLAVGLAIGAAGCIPFVAGSPTAGQNDVIGLLEITSTMCGTDANADDHTGCQNGDVAGGDANGNSDFELEGDDTVQVLLGYRVPLGSDAPAAFSTDSEPGPTPLTFTSNPGYASELQRLSPAPPGQRWIGYVSTAFDYDVDPDAAASHRITVSPEFSLPRGADGSPFQGPFQWRQVAGARISDDPGEAARAVNCDTDLDGLFDDTICADAPSPGTLASSASESTRDLGILAGSAVTTGAGISPSVPFIAKYAGSATLNANFSLEASTTVPGGSATPSQATLLPPADSSTPINVAVNVPPGTPPGTYGVTLTARLSNGQVRSNTNQLTVQAAQDKTRPGVRVTVVRGQSVAKVLARGLALRERLTEAGRVTDELFVSSGLLARPVRVARKTTRFSRAGTKRVRLRLTRRARTTRARRGLLGPRRVTFTLRSTARDLAGNSRRATKRVRLKRR